MTPNPLLDAALAYAARGWPVFPCHHPTTAGCSCGQADCTSIGKHPRYHEDDLPHGCHSATTAAAQIRTWWQRWPRANIGLQTGTIVVVDMDPRHHSDVGEELLEAEGCTFPDTVESITGGGGRHLFYHHARGEVPNSVGAEGKGLAQGIDVRGAGGLVILPPSLHASRQRYIWEASSHPDMLDMEPLPAWIIGRTQTAKPSRKAQASESGAIASGQRNTTLASYAGTMRRKGMEADEILAALLRVNTNRCDPPLPDAEVQKIVQSVGRYPPAEPHTPFNAEDPLTPLSPLSPQLLITDWPKMEACAFTGLVGDFVTIVGPESEADPVALLIEFLIAFGNTMGRKAHCVAEADYHAFNEYAVLVGATAKGRKGTSWGHVRRLFRQVDEVWVDTRLQNGLSSGEGLIWAVRDGTVKKKKGESPDPGITDKRLLVLETEFSSTLKVLEREGNTLSGTMRNGWDNSGTLRTMTKNSPAQATGAHISIIGHITKDELLRRLADTEAGNGFGNRFLWVCVRRSKELPEGGSPDQHRLNELAKHLSQSLLFAKVQGTLRRDDQAKRRWAEIYHDLSEEKPGLMGAMIARAEAHVLRLSGLYAVMDMSSAIKLEHLDSAYAVWQYCEASAQYIFGASLGDPVADTLLRFIRGSQDGATRQEMNDHLGGHRSSDQIVRALQKLYELGLAEWHQRQTGGRPVEIWHAKQGTAEKAEKAE